MSTDTERSDSGAHRRADLDEDFETSTMSDEERRAWQHLRAELADLRDDVHALRKRQDSTAARVWDVATKLAVPAMLAVVGWIWQVDKFSTNNAKDIDRAEELILELDSRVDEQPPEWLREIVGELKAQNLDVLQRLSRLEALMSDTRKKQGDDR